HLARITTGDPKVATLAAALCAVEPQLVIWASVVMADALLAFLVLSAFVCGLRFVREKHMSHAVLAALLACMAAFTKPVAYLFPIVLSAAFLFALGTCRDRRLLQGAALSAGIAILAIGGWQIRNGRLTGFYGFSRQAQQVMAQSAL